MCEYVELMIGIKGTGCPFISSCWSQKEDNVYTFRWKDEQEASCRHIWFSPAPGSAFLAGLCFHKWCSGIDRRPQSEGHLTCTLWFPGLKVSLKAEPSKGDFGTEFEPQLDSYISTVTLSKDLKFADIWLFLIYKTEVMITILQGACKD